MVEAIEELVTISRSVGSDPALVQGGGGNTSVKTADGKYMYIKASGTALKDMDGRRGWRRMRLEEVLAITKDCRLLSMETHRRESRVVDRLLAACDDTVADDSRPSVEAHLHAFLARCVVHLHPSSVGAFANARNGRAAVEELFRRDRLAPLWVDYVDPGFTLANKMAGAVRAYRSRFKSLPERIFLEKHGLIVSGESTDSVLRLVRSTIRRCRRELSWPAGRPPAVAQTVSAAKARALDDARYAIRRAFFAATGRRVKVSFLAGGVFTAFMKRPDAARLLAAGPLTPDELLYGGGPAMWLDRVDSKKIAAVLSRRIAAGGRPQAAFLARGLGLFIASEGDMAPVVRDVVASSLVIRANAADMGGVVTLSRRRQDFINRWESEAFRKDIASGQTGGELDGRIAVVTGAASGLGKSIAAGLAEEGAVVALLDVDAAAAEKAAAAISGDTGAQVTALTCDVTDEKSVETAFRTALDMFGGLDILVNAAGIAPAYCLIDFDVKKWRRALDVNLTGYFLASRQAARIMVRQDMGGCIVNVSSKSGLEASRDNTAYNATKAGEIHMARGWALELGEHGIRVNSIAPGNVFEGSKIWNPAYIRTCAKKYGIRPEEVVDYYVGKTALNRDITGRDVAASVVFLCSDAAATITGQTLVADSGQVMVR